MTRGDVPATMPVARIVVTLLNDMLAVPATGDVMPPSGPDASGSAARGPNVSIYLDLPSMSVYVYLGIYSFMT